MASPRFGSPPLRSQKDVIEVCVRCERDPHPSKIDLIPGAYRDEEGKPWVMPFILRLEREMVQSPTWNHEYVIFLGLDLFNEMVPCLILGEKSKALVSGRAFGVQMESGTSALRVGAEMLVRHARFNTFYLSSPTWDNHEAVFLYAGFSNSCTYRYWDAGKRGLDFEGMIEDLRGAPENAVIVLQICAHNPTGVDLNRQQWIELADLMQERKLFPFFDAAYQGLGTGDLEEDAWPVRYFVERGFETFIAQSFSKNMGLYSERTGCLTIVLDEKRDKAEMETLKLMMTVIIRSQYLCPSRHGAELVIKILQSPELCEQWKECLQQMQERLRHVRAGLRSRLEKLGTPGTWRHITDQAGMFSFTGLSRNQVAALADKHIYFLPNGRANMCALNDHNLDRFAEAIHETVLHCTD